MRGKKIVLLLQGGNALGAFQSGVWAELERFVREDGHEVVAVAGASIGAVNAALIARHLHDPDGAAPALHRLWTCEMPNKPVSFIPLPGEYWRAWNGMLTGLLLGNGALFRPLYPNWTPLAEAFRFRAPLYDVRATEQTMHRLFGRYRGTAPLLGVLATDVQSGEPRLFDSSREHITPTMIAASSAVPILFSPVEIEGRHYWDGDFRSESLLQHILPRLGATLPRRGAPHDLLIVAVDMFHEASHALPDSSMSAQYRFLNILLGDKPRYDAQAIAKHNSLFDAITQLRQLAQTCDTPDPLLQAINIEYEKLLDSRIGHIEFLHIGRTRFEHEHVSRDFDYSPSYIERLIAQGRERAAGALKTLAPGR